MSLTSLLYLDPLICLLKRTTTHQLRVVLPVSDGTQRKGLSNSPSDLKVFALLEAAEGKRNKCWYSLINEIDRFDIQLKLADWKNEQFVKLIIDCI